MTGNRELGARINKIIKKIETSSDETLTKMSNEGLLYGIMVAPRRTGATAMNIKARGAKNYRVLYITPTEKAYNIYIDRGTVPKKWGTNINDPRMIDKRKREEKLYYFIGNDSVEGKTLKFMKQNFKRHVDELGKQIMVS
jgi:hypothetical protein